jgi:adenosine deaminase
VSLESYIRAAPKAELHVHLPGTVRPATLLTLARRNGVDLPVATEAEARAWCRVCGVDRFLTVYTTVCRCLRTADDFELVVWELGETLARQHTRYAEVEFGPGFHAYLGVSFEVAFPGLTRGRARVREAFGVELNWIFAFVRGRHPERARWPDYVTRAAIEGRHAGVVALGLGGLEPGRPPEPYAPYFERARAAGLHSAPHAGETAGPESVWGAVRALGAERIGHGVRAVEDPALVEYLAAHRIALEVCPTSNVRLGVVPSLAAHPLRRLLDAGVPVTVNSDDPALFGTTLTDELLTLCRPFGCDAGQVDEVLLNAVRHSFLPPARRRALEAAFRDELRALKPAHGLA